MALVVTPEGRYRVGFHRVGDRFTVDRRTEVERTEAHPDGRIAYFYIRDHSDNSTMTIDEEDAERLEALWQAVLAKQVPPADLEKYLAWVFDVKMPPEHDTVS